MPVLACSYADICTSFGVHSLSSCYHSKMSSVINVKKEGSLRNVQEEPTFGVFVLKLGQSLTFCF